MVIESKNGKTNLFLVILIVVASIAGLIIVVIAGEGLLNIITTNETIDLISPITNDGHIYEGNNITFSATCYGDKKQLIICQEAAICNSETQEGLICKGEFTKDENVDCVYTAKATDIGINQYDIASCCNKGNNCDTTVEIVNDWEVKAQEAQEAIDKETEQARIHLTSILQSDYSKKIEIKDLKRIVGEYNLEIEFNTSDDKNGRIRLEGIKDINNLKYIQTGSVKETKNNGIMLKTDAIAININEIKNAEIALPKTGNVNKIVKCEDWNFNDFNCNNDNWEITNISFIDDGFNIIFNVSNFSGYAGAEITIINVQSYPSLYENWTVEFTTIGKADLQITGVNGTSWSNVNEDEELKFLDIRCGNNTLNYEWINDSVLVRDYECNESGFETSKVLRANKHTLEFKFGDDIKYAFNQVIITTMLIPFGTGANQQNATTGTLTEMTYAFSTLAQVTAACFAQINQSDRKTCGQAGGSNALDGYFLVNFSLPAYSVIHHIIIRAESNNTLVSTDWIALAVRNWSDTKNNYTTVNRTATAATLGVIYNLTYNITQSATDRSHFISANNRVIFMVHTNGTNTADYAADYLELNISYTTTAVNYKSYFYNITFWDNVTTVSYGLGRGFNGSFTVGDLDENELFNVSMSWYEGDSSPDTIIISNNTAGSNMSNYTSAQINGSMRYTGQNLTNLNYRVGYNYSLVIYVCDADGCNQSNSTVLFINNSLPTIMNITLYDNITSINYNLSRQFNCSTYILDGDQNEKLNITFEWYEGVGAQTTTKLSSSANNSAFNLTQASNGTLYFSPLNLTVAQYRFGYNYTCRVRVYDAALQQQIWRNSTTLFINDTSPPDLYLYWPLNNTLNLTSNYINFTFNVSDNSNSGVKNCTLWINNIVNRSELSPLDDITKIQNITTYLRNNDYMWKISCTDKNNNINTSESRNISINTNTAPTQAWNLSIQVGTALMVNESTATNKYLLSTHDFTPIINWTNGTDSDGNQIDMFLCILSNPTNNACDVYSTWTNQSNLTNFPGLNHSGRWYVNITTNDGTVNGTTYSTNFTINNTLPVISGSALLGNDTHDNTPGLNWSVIDPDNGGNYQWPADTQVDYIVIGNVSGEGVYYNNTDGDANNNSEVTSALPWNYTLDDWTANRTYTVTVWAGDGSETNGSSYSATLRLFDNLPNITRIWMADDGSLEDCNLAAGSQCSLQAVSHNNVSNLVIQINATDLDRDCDTSSSLATLYLCNKTTGACNENNYDFNFSLATITKNADDTRNCSYMFASAQGPAFTPQFFVPGSTAYLLNINVSSQTGQAPGSIKEGNNNATWWYKNVTSVNYTGSITMGDGSVSAGTWNPGTNMYNITNWGNVILNITWNITNMSGPGARGWEVNGTDLEIDDDNARDADTGNLAARGLNATNYTFVFGTGLELCVAYDCNSVLRNESMATHWHIYPLTGIPAGTYYGNLTYRLFPR